MQEGETSSRRGCWRGTRAVPSVGERDVEVGGELLHQLCEGGLVVRGALTLLLGALGG